MRQKYVELNGVPIDVSLSQHIGKRFSIVLGGAFCGARGNRNFDPEDERPFFIVHWDYPWLGPFQRPGFQEPNHLSTEIRTSLSNQFSGKLLGRYKMLDTNKHDLLVGLGMHFTSTRLTFIHSLLDVTVSSPFQDPTDVVALVPLFHSFISYSGYMDFSYIYHISERGGLIITSYYAHMRNWKGYFGINGGLTIKL